VSCYNVLILTRKDKSGHDYQSESLYFGENERLMQVGFYKTVRKAQPMPDAEYVVVWNDTPEQIVKVKIER
jgi:hypothetical protein